MSSRKVQATSCIEIRHRRTTQESLRAVVPGPIRNSARTKTDLSRQRADRQRRRTSDTSSALSSIAARGPGLLQKVQTWREQPFTEMFPEHTCGTALREHRGDTTITALRTLWVCVRQWFSSGWMKAPGSRTRGFSIWSGPTRWLLA
jgi:hypothetical protein